MDEKTANQIFAWLEKEPLEAKDYGISYKLSEIQTAYVVLKRPIPNWIRSIINSNTKHKLMTSEERARKIEEELVSTMFDPSNEDLRAPQLRMEVFQKIFVKHIEEAQREAVEKAKKAFHKEIKDWYVEFGEEGNPRDLYILNCLIEDVVGLTPEKVLGEG